MTDTKTMNISNPKTGTKAIALTGLLFAVSIVLAVVENMLPPIPIAVPGVKIGLSNIAVMYAVFFVGAKYAYGIAVLKSLFVVITRGLIAGSLSLAGGLLSVTVMLAILVLTKKRASIAIISISGAIFHNVGQFIMISLIYIGTSLWLYLPVLLISGVLTGLLTAGLLKVILPAIKRLV